MIKNEFIHLHLHTEYSMLDGAIKIPDLAKTLKENEIRACAITDHGTLAGAVDFYIQMTSNGIKPIIGSEFYVAPASRRDKSTKRGEDHYYHLVLIAKDNEGFKNLAKLSSLSFIEGMYFKPRIDLELLAEYSKGIIGLSACKKGLVSNALLKGEYEAAKEIAVNLNSILSSGGEHNFYLELMYHSLEDQKEINDGLIKISKETDIPLVATNDVHYLAKKDAKYHDIILCIGTGNKIYDEDRLRYGSDEFYLRNFNEMNELFGNIPGAIENTVKIAEQCNVEFSIGDLKKTEMPVFDIPHDYKPQDKNKKLIDDYFEFLCEKGFQKLIADNKDEKIYRERLETELKIIEQMNFPHYFLIVQDFVNWAKNNDIPIGPGRGSAAGSLVSYLLGITMVDPLEYGLLFERFLNPDRIGLPDIDIDICYEQRGKVIDYLKQKYGVDHVSQIATVNKLGPKMAIRDVGRVLDIPLSEIDRITKLIPDLIKDFDEVFHADPKLRQIAQDKKYSELFDAAIALNGLSRHTGVHAAGIVISQDKIFEKVPCATGKNDELVTQYDKDFVEKIGLVKWDLLGLKNLTVIDKCVKSIRDNVNPDFDIYKIDINDKKTFELFASGDATGIFQLDAAGPGGGIKDFSRKFKPDNIQDLIALLAIYRPGPLQSGMIEDFISRKHGKTSIKYPHPLLEPILKETYGVIIYQEQVMQISNILAGYSLGEADLLRRAMGKKKPEVMAKQRKRFLEGTKEKGINEKKANDVFELMEFFAGYGFNKSHSAAYAILSYQTAYLKTHYPVYFMASLMSAEKKNENKIVEYINDCRKMRIRVLPPDINFSEYEFVVIGNEIRFGLSAIKNVGEKAIQEIVEERKKNGAYLSLIDFLERINLSTINRKMLESLILCGALDSLKVYRSQLIQVLDSAIKEALRRSNEKEIGQISLFSSENSENTTEFNQDFIKFPNIEEMDEIQKLKHEKELIGLYITGHPIEKYTKVIMDYNLNTVNEIKNFKDGDQVAVIGIFETMAEGKIKSNFKRIIRGIFEDMTGRINYTIWEPVVTENEKYLDVGKVLLIFGSIDTKMKDTQLVVKTIFPIEKSRQKLTKRVNIFLNSVGLSEETIKKIRDTLETSPGKVPVFIHILSNEFGEVIIKPHSKFYVNITQKLLNTLEKIAGEDNLKFNLPV